MTDTRIFYREVRKGGTGLSSGHSDLISLGGPKYWFRVVGVFNALWVMLICTGRFENLQSSPAHSLCYI